MRKIKTIDIIGVYFKHIRLYAWRTIFVLASIVAGESIVIAVPVLYKQLFDLLATGKTALLSVQTELINILVVILLLHSGSWFLHISGSLLNNRVTAGVMAELERTSFAYMARHSYSFFANSFAGSLVRKVRKLSRSYEDLMDTVQFRFLPLFISVVGSLTVIWFRSHTLVYIAGGIILFFIVVNYFVAIWKLKYDNERARKDSEVTGKLADAISNSVNIRLFTRDGHENSIYKKSTEEYKKIQIFSWDLGEINSAIQFAFMIAIEFMVMYKAIDLWQGGLLTIGDFALLQAYLGAMFINMRQLGRMIRNVYEAFADAEEMVAILKTPHEIQDLKRAKPLHAPMGKIDFKKVTFRYNKTRTVFEDLNLHIKAKEKVAFVGPSGSGKTTIIQLLLRSFDIQIGEISIDGQNIAKATQDSVRAHIALVPQDPILFHRSLAENISYGKLDATMDEIIAASKAARCHDFINQLSEGYHTHVGERGIKLSGGERQRVAIARAILENAPILILDEATSSLDSESEALIQDALETLMQDKTTIVIAHRLSTILKMDRIIVIHNGEVADEGTHTQLMAKKGGLYHKLWKIQSSGFME